MNRVVLIMASIFGVGALVFVAVIFGYVGFTNTANKYENDIQAQYAENQNVYDNGWKEITETAQVPASQVAMLKDVYLGAIKGTYGNDGSKAMFQAMRERNIDINQITFIKVQFTIERFRKTFTKRQTEMISRGQSYKNFLTATTTGRFYNMMGNYPRIDLAKYIAPVTSAKTSNDFETKQSDPLKVF